jgi:hypothetical protein
MIAALDVAELLAGGPRTAEDLAADAGARPDLLLRLLRAAAGAGVLHGARSAARGGRRAGAAGRGVPPAPAETQDSSARCGARPLYANQR